MSNSEYSFCPICGERIDGGRSLLDHALSWTAHRCPSRSLASIDGAHRRDPDAETAKDWPAAWSRFASGLEMMDWCEQDDPGVW